MTCSRSPIASIIAVDPFGDRLQPGPDAAFVVLVAFLVSFLAIRTSARLTRSVSWWPGGVQAQGVHIHHLVWGVGLMLICGFLAFAVPLEAPWWHIVAIGFGTGAGFTLDEFALLVRLQDVYWAEEGRASFDAVVCSFAFAALVVVGTRPFGLNEPLSVTGTVLVAVTVLAIAAIAFAKGRVLLGVIGLFVPVAGVVGAVRLGRPGSPWARARYDADKHHRAEQRYAAARLGQRVRRRISALIAGEPSS